MVIVVYNNTASINSKEVQTMIHAHSDFAELDALLGQPI